MTGYKATITLNQDEVSMMSYALGLLAGISMQLQRGGDITMQDQIQINTVVKKAHEVFMPIREKILGNLEVINGK